MAFKVSAILRWILLIFVLNSDLFISYQANVRQTEETMFFLKHFKFSHMDGMRSELFCPVKNSYIIGVKIRVSDHLNQTFPMVTALKIICSDRMTPSYYPDNVLVLDKNIGNWSDYGKCPFGQFAYGITFHLQSIQTFSLIADEDYDEPSSTHMFDVFELGRARYVSGVTLNCSTSSKTEDDYSWSDQLPSINSVSLGYNSGFGLRIYCVENRVVTGITIMEEAITTYDDGERFIPVKLLIQCSLLKTPGSDCHPNLSWEAIQYSQCYSNNGSLPMHLQNVSISEMRAQNVTCNFRNLIGATLNVKIENIDEIRNSFKLTRFQHPGGVLIPKLLSFRFRVDWANKYNLSLLDYDKVVRNALFSLVVDLKLNLTSLTLNINPSLFEVSPVAQKLAKRFKITHEVKFVQLVGFCGVFKIYFPLFKAQFRTYFETNVDNINTTVLIGEEGIKLSVK